MQLLKKQPLIVIKAVQYRVTPGMTIPGHAGEKPFCKPDPLHSLQIIQPTEMQLELVPTPDNDCGEPTDFAADMIKEEDPE